jgi:hypothetical protein
MARARPSSPPDSLDRLVGAAPALYTLRAAVPGPDGLSGCRGSGASASTSGLGGRDGCARETGHSGIDLPGRGTGTGPDTRVA